MSQVNKLGEVLRKRRKEEGITQKEMAKMIGIGPPHLCMMEKGSIPISDLHLQALWRKIKCSLEEKKAMQEAAWESRSVIDLPYKASVELKILLWTIVANHKLLSADKLEGLTDVVLQEVEYQKEA